MNRHVAPQTMSSREFNQNTGRAKQATEDGPVLITDRGQPTHVLLRYEAYQALVAETTKQEPAKSLFDALYDPEGDDDVDLMSLIPPRSDTYLRDPFENEAD